MFPVPKIIPPEDDQLPNESRKFWSGVTQAILDKQYGQATTLKQELEERQRQKATERQKKDEVWQPRFFKTAVDPSGIPDLTEDGKLALKGLHNDQFRLEQNSVLGA
jgi:hypothetical protein